MEEMRAHFKINISQTSDSEGTTSLSHPSQKLTSIVGKGKNNLPSQSRACSVFLHKSLKRGKSKVNICAEMPHVPLLGVR